MKFKVGDKVKLKDDLVIDEKYGAIYYGTSHKKYVGKKLTIRRIDEHDSTCQIEEDPNTLWFSEQMFEKIEKKTKQEQFTEELVDNVISKFTDTVRARDEEMNKSLEKALKEINKTVNQRTIYDDIIQQQVLEKAQNLSLEDIEKTIKKDLDNYIKKEYGVVPKKIEVSKGTKKKEISGIFHKKFEEILKIVDKGVPLMLTGPAGAGKNYTLEQVAKALNLDFYFSNAITQEYKLTGFIDAGGTYQETQFYKAFKDGGLFFLDEVDASVPEALIILNSAIANGYFDFPNGRINAHKDFRVVCAGNTYGTGADMVYVGRNALDGATLDRFAVIEFDYDEEVEKKLAYDNELYDFVTSLREIIKGASLRYIVSMRATINATKLLEIGMNKKDILKSVIIKNMQPDDLNVIVNKVSTSNEWGKEFKNIVEHM